MHRTTTRLGAALALLLLALVPRLPLLLAPAADLHYISEEVHRGTTAKHWMEGMVLPLADYQFVAFHGGTFLTSAVAVPLFALFGQSLMALKATGLVFHAAAVVLLFACISRIAGRRAAWFGAILLAGTPPGYATLNLVAYGTHVEGIVPSLLALLAYLWFLEAPGPRRLALVGVACGFGVFFTYSVVLTVAAIGAHALWTGHLRSRSAIGHLIAGGALGFSPWVYLNVRSGLGGLRLYGGIGGPGRALGGSADSPGARLGELLTYGIPRAGCFEDLGPVPGSAFDIAYTLLLALGFLGLFLGRPARSNFDPRFLALVPALFLAVLAVKGYAVGWPIGQAVAFRYVYVLYPILLLGLALLASRVAARGARAARAATVSVVLLAVLCSAASLRITDSARLGADAALPGYDNWAFGRFVALVMVLRPEVLASSLELARERMEEEEFRRFHHGLAQNLMWLSDLDPSKTMRRELQIRVQAAPAAVELLDRVVPWWTEGVPRNVR